MVVSRPGHGGEPLGAQAGEIESGHHVGDHDHAIAEQCLGVAADVERASLEVFQRIARAQ